MRTVADPTIRAEVKDITRLAGRVQRFVADRQDDDDERPTMVIHPSELSSDDACPRAIWHRLMGHPEVSPEKPVSFTLLSIWAEGSAIHDKWQRWLWDMGELLGEFRCYVCRSAGRSSDFWSKAPARCVRCGAPRHFLRYREVPAEDPSLMIAGRADSRVGLELQEYKSVAEGTVRIDDPELYSSHSYKMFHPRWGNEFTWVDLPGIWRAIKIPFRPHLRQISLYLWLTGLDEGQVIYECKWNQQVKEFPVKLNERLVAPLLEQAADIADAVRTGREVECTRGGEVECPKCHVYEGGPVAEVPGRQSGDGRPDARRQGRTGESWVSTGWTTGRRGSAGAVQPDGADRRSVDGAVLPARSVARPHRRVAGAPGDRRAVRRVNL